MDDINDLKPSTAQHDAIVDCMGRLVVAPIDFTKPGTRVLDSGTGDGMHKTPSDWRRLENHWAVSAGANIYQIRRMVLMID